MLQNTQQPLLRLAHISDLHFSKITWNPSQFLSKRWIGNCNLIFSRQHAFRSDHLPDLLSFFKNLNINAVLITGDLSCTSLKSEFELAKTFIETLKNQGFQVFTLPGNHDQYTKNAYKNQTFYKFFEEIYPSSERLMHTFSLKKDNLTTSYLGNQWWLFGLDTAIATPLLASSGYFSSELELTLEKALLGIPSDHRVILMNHFPLFSNESNRKSLKRKEALKALLERFPQVKFFLHGHTHRQSIADLRKSNLPIILDSGCIAKKSGATWNLIDIHPESCSVEVFQNEKSVQDNKESWKAISQSTFHW